MNRNNICPICGYPNLQYPAYDDYGCPSSEICSCCGTEFGYHDASKTHEELRKKWLDEGMLWFSQERKPSTWNAINQLKSIGVEI